jgi:hypothetical protein
VVTLSLFTGPGQPIVRNIDVSNWQGAMGSFDEFRMQVLAEHEAPVSRFPQGEGPVVRVAAESRVTFRQALWMTVRCFSAASGGVEICLGGTCLRFRGDLIVQKVADCVSVRLAHRGGEPRVTIQRCPFSDEPAPPPIDIGLRGNPGASEAIARALEDTLKSTGASYVSLDYADDELDVSCGDLATVWAGIRLAGDLELALLEGR